MIQRGVQLMIKLTANVKHKTIEPFIKETISLGKRVYTDEYSIDTRLCVWGYDHKNVHHGRGEYARDEDGDGLCEVHVNMMEGFWSLLRVGSGRIGAYHKRNSCFTRVSSSCAQHQKGRQSVCCMHSLSSWSR